MPRKTALGAAQSFLYETAVNFKGCECLIWPYNKLAKGYGLLRDGRKTIYAHRRVCEIVHGPCPDGHECAHSCGNPSCVNPAHVSWKTPKQNAADKLIHGTHNKGSRHGLAKLTEDDVLAIKLHLEKKTASQDKLAALFGVSQATIHRIKVGACWGWLSY